MATTELTLRQLNALADMIAERLIKAQDEMMPLEWLITEKGLSKSYVYHNVDKLGGVRLGKKLFFSKNGIEAILRNGSLE